MLKEYRADEREFGRGKLKPIAVTELHIVERNEVLIRRDEDGQIIKRREMNEDDRQMETFDGEETITIEDDD